MQYPFALSGVMHLSMELDPVYFSFFVGKSRGGTGFRGCRYRKAFGHFAHVIGMAHPTDIVFIHAVKERTLFVFDLALAVFACIGVRDHAANLYAISWQP